MKIVVLDGYAVNPGDLSWKAFEKLGEVVVYDRTPIDKIVERVDGAEMLITNKIPIGKKEMDSLPTLKYIGVMATGYNIIDIEVAKNKGIIVSNVPGYSTASVVQLTFALLLELCLRVQRHSDSVMEGQWSRSPDFSFWDYPLTELAGKTIGIIGFGSIGQEVANVASAFGMNVVGTSRRRPDQSHRKNFEWVEIPELFKRADVISIHCPLTPETEGLINKSNLSQMKSSAFLLNTARGQIIVEEDLAEALNTNVIAGAGLDVLSVEPPKNDNPLFKAKNCIITPHIAWATKESRTRVMKIAADNLASFIQQKPVNVVNA